MYWTEQHNISILCKEVVFENPYIHKKNGSPQRSETWKKIIDVPNNVITAPHLNFSEIYASSVEFQMKFAVRMSVLGQCKFG